MKLPWGELLKEELMLRIKQIIWKIRVSVLKKLGLVDQRTVYFEGGLGSQMLAYIEYNERNKSSKKAVFANLDYFKNIENDFTDEAGLSRWTWKLDRYGIYRHELIELTKIKKLINKSFKVRQQSHTEIFYNFREKKSESYQKIFAINDKDVEEYLRKKFRSDKGDFAVIHIRRGDYLNVASKVISTEELIKFINKIKKLLPENVLISSDSFLPSLEKDLFSNTLSEFNLVYVDPHEDPVLVHHLMRSSAVLVASNSTFSFTAGLLAKSGCMVFFPTNYFGQNRASDSRSFVFRQPFEFLVG
jgi:hypothetical protein